MTDLDLERLGDVWRQRPDPTELEHLRLTAEKVRRRARWTQFIDALSAAVVSAVVLLLVAANPELETMIVGGAAILVLLAGQIRSRRLRQAELRSLTGSIEQMLDQSIGRLEGTLKRTRFHLVALAPALGLGLVFAYVVDDRGGRELLTQLVSSSWKGGLLIAAAFVLLAAMFIYFAGRMRADRKELERMLALRQSYREEQDSTDG